MAEPCCSECFQGRFDGAPRFRDSGVRFTALLPRHTLLPADDLAWLADLPEAAKLSDMQRAIAVSMRHGVTWTNLMVRDEFAPIDSTDARAALQGLVVSGISETTGTRRGTKYVIAARFRLPKRGPPLRSSDMSRRLTWFLPVADANSAAEASGVKSGVNSSAILDALRANRELSARSLMAATGLTRRQVIYALRGLVQQDRVVRVGGPGSPTTTYASGDQSFHGSREHLSSESRWSRCRGHGSVAASAPSTRGVGGPPKLPGSRLGLKVRRAAPPGLAPQVGAVDPLVVGHARAPGVD